MGRPISGSRTDRSASRTCCSVTTRTSSRLSWSTRCEPCVLPWYGRGTASSMPARTEARRCRRVSPRRSRSTRRSPTTPGSGCTDTSGSRGGRSPSASSRPGSRCTRTRSGRTCGVWRRRASSGARCIGRRPWAGPRPCTSPSSAPTATRVTSACWPRSWPGSRPARGPALAPSAWRGSGAQYLAVRGGPKPGTRAAGRLGLAVLQEAMASAGFDPRFRRGPDGSVEVTLRDCPFRELLDDHRELVCAVHRGLVEGMLAALRPPLELRSFSPLAERIDVPARGRRSSVLTSFGLAPQGHRRTGR